MNNNNNEVQFVPEWNVGERVSNIGLFDELDETIIGDINLQNLQQKLGNIEMSDEDKFKKIVNFILNTNSLFKNSIDKIVSNINKIKEFKFLNPYGYVLGGYIVDNNKINKGKFNEAKEFIKNLPEGPLTDADIIKYGRYFINLN